METRPHPNEMIERVIAVFRASDLDCSSWPQAILEELARVVIKAMREPTGMMYMVGGDVAVSSRTEDQNYKPEKGMRIGDLAARAAWQVMIVQALKS